MNVKGIFKIHDTHGYPLDQIVTDLREQNLNVDWKDWIEDSLKAGWHYDQAAKVALSALEEINSKKDFRMLFVITYLMVLDEIPLTLIPTYVIMHP